LTKGRWVLAGVALVVVVVLAAAGALVWHPALPAVAVPPANSFDRALVKKGQALAHLGDCASCHTASTGKPYAGGRALPTPFGTIYSSNITPSADTGIGKWSREAFVRAMREGVARDGSHLYPAFPYDHFTKAGDDDLAALYAYLMTLPAVEARPPANKLDWPYGQRSIVAAWDLLYLRKGPDTNGDRGRVLAEGLAHCGACHTPRNKLGAEDSARPYDGAWIEGWFAPPLNARSPAAQPWTADELFAYLRTGLAGRHAAAAGPMARVTREFAEAPEQDVRAIAAYFANLMAKAPAATNKLQPIDHADVAARASPIGSALFGGGCAQCHEAGAPMMQQGGPPLAWSTSLRLDTPNNTLQVLLHGLKSPAGASGPAMPGYAADFDDRELAALAAYLRARFTDLPPWPVDLRHAAEQVRKGANE